MIVVAFLYGFLPYEARKYREMRQNVKKNEEKKEISIEQVMVPVVLPEVPIEQARDVISDVFGGPALPPLRMDELRAVRKLTLDVVSISKVGQVVALVQGELTEQVMPSKFHPDGKAPAWCLDIYDVTRQNSYILVCNTVLASALQRAGGPRPLTGRYFAIRCGEIEAGKRYRHVDVVELERAE